MTDPPTFEEWQANDEEAQKLEEVQKLWYQRAKRQGWFAFWFGLSAAVANLLMLIVNVRAEPSVFFTVMGSVNAIALGFVSVTTWQTWRRLRADFRD